MRLPLSKLALPALAVLILLGGAAQAIEPLDGRGLAPYQFNPPPRDLSPSQEAIAQAYRSRLQGMLSGVERQTLRKSPLGREQIRNADRELGRVDRLLGIR